VCNFLNDSKSLILPQAYTSFSEIGDVFCTIGVRELQKTASEAFCQFGEYHRQMEKYGIQMLKATKPVRKFVSLSSISGFHPRMVKFFCLYIHLNKKNILVKLLLFKSS